MGSGDEPQPTRFPEEPDECVKIGSDLGFAQITDPVGVGDGDGHIVRGGSWFHKATFLRAASRQCAGGTHWGNVGFRCARSLSTISMTNQEGDNV